MSSLTIGTPAPAFALPDETGEIIKLSDFKGQKLIVYFYPKDDTSGCTAESCAFRDALPKFSKLKIPVVGVSKDSMQSHIKFKEKYDLTFPLLSDENGSMCQDYGVWAEKSMYGRKYMGIERTTFLIDEKGRIAHIWAKVKVDGHVEDVLAQVKST